MGKLAEGYAEYRVYSRNQRGRPMHIILTPDGHVWPRERAEEKHPECFESGQTLQVGCPVSVIGRPILPDGYGLVCYINTLHPFPITIRYQDGSVEAFHRDQLRLLECPNTDLEDR